MTHATIEYGDSHAAPAAIWRWAAESIRAWAVRERISLQDLVVLVPFGQLLAPAREAFAASPGWQPRIETTGTLCEALGPPVSAADGPSLDPTIDRLAMASLLRQREFGADWERRDRRGFELVVQSMVDTAQALSRAAMACAPGARETHWASVRSKLGHTSGHGALEGLLLQVSVEWAAAGEGARTDRLFAHRPGAWVLIQAGGPDPLARALVDANDDTPCLVIDLDPPAGAEFASVAQGTAPKILLCEDLESEALAAASQVIEAINAGHTPVALVALDRVLVRRVRALLERAGVETGDETGWRLSTTRAGARIMAWLRAAAPDAKADDRLDWLKGWPPALADPAALQGLEASWRRPQRRRQDAQSTAAEVLWGKAEEALAWATTRREQSLADWLLALRKALSESGEWDLLAADAAGTAVLGTLRLDADGDRRWRALAQGRRVALAGFSAWVDAELEGGAFVPEATGAEVLLVPLAHTVLRPFGAVVMPGADARHLGQVEANRGLIGEALASDMGLPCGVDRRLRDRQAFVHLLRQPNLVVSRRRLDGDELLAASPDLLALSLARRLSGAAPLIEQAWRAAMQREKPDPVLRPMPQAARALPASLTASQVEALRACPYRFFARAVLRLQEDEELERGVEKRDYGTWLHAVLHRFHNARPSSGRDDRTLLFEAADAEANEAAFDVADLLPFRASFEAFAPAYLAWLQDVEAQGWSWREGETLVQAAPSALAPTTLRGRIDRIDRKGSALRLIDYKTGSAASLAERMKPRSEDTQLAFYAALMLAKGASEALEAAYLTLDDAAAPRLLEHLEVAGSATLLVDGLASELARLRAGAPLPALGEGATCDYCEVRGLCRRDHWGDRGANP